MFSLTDMYRSLTGAVLLLRNRRSGLTYLDLSMDGLWRSFAVIFLLLPINALASLALMRTSDTAIAFWENFFSAIPLIALDWVLFPFLLVLAASALGVSQTVTTYITARNWSAPIASLIFTIPFVLQGAGWVGDGPAALLALIALVVVLRYHYCVLRIALEAQPAMALGLVAADFFLTLFLISVIDGL